MQSLALQFQFLQQERLLQQVLLGTATDCVMDKNGRLLLNGPLIKHAGLEKSIMLVGQLKKFEIWSDDIWNNKVNKWRSEETDESETSILSDIRI